MTTCVDVGFIVFGVFESSAPLLKLIIFFSFSAKIATSLSVPGLQVPLYSLVGDSSGEVVLVFRSFVDGSLFAL